MVIDLSARWKGEPIRLDQYLAGTFQDYSRSLIQKVIDGGAVTVNGHAAKASYKVHHGDNIHISLPENSHEAPAAEDIPLDLLYEDEFLAIINKPADMVVHPAKGHWSGTLVNALRFRFDQLSGLNGDYRPGIVHRLDRDTSGVIMVAKDEQTHRELSLQFERRKVFKEYVALTQGVLDRDSDYIEHRISKHPHDRIKMIVTDEEDEGKEASSFYEVIERFRGYTLCRIHPRTGAPTRSAFTWPAPAVLCWRTRYTAAGTACDFRTLLPILIRRPTRYSCPARPCTPHACESFILV